MINVLIIDDDSEDRFLISRRISKAAASTAIFEADSLCEAFQQIEKQGIDIALLDLNLVESNGLETLQLFMQGAGDVPFVVLTGSSDDKIALRAIESGAQDFIRKAEIENPWIHHCLKNAIKRHELLLEKRSMDIKVQERTLELTSANLLLAKKTEEAEKLALVARYTDNAVIITDSKTRIEWVNDGFTRMTGYELSDVVGKRPMDFMYGPETDPGKLNFMTSQVFNQRGFDTEVIKYRKDGTPIWVSSEARPISDEHGNIKCFIAIESDITDRVNSTLERQQLNEQLIQASRHAGMAEIANGVLHNVGNILNSVNVSASVIRKQFQHSAIGKLAKLSDLISENEKCFSAEITGDQRIQKIPTYIAKLNEKLASERNSVDSEFDDLLNNVEHIKQIIAVQQTMAKTSGIQQELSPAKLIGDAITANKGPLANHQIDIVTEIDEDIPVLNSDKHMILQILVNLIKNAKDAMVEHETQDPKISIAVKSTESFIEFEVSDNGIGIPKSKIEQIFQHGFTTKKTGHGFGLHSSANAATELGGALSVASPGIGQGATFKLQVPASFEPTETRESKPVSS